MKWRKSIAPRQIVCVFKAVILLICGGLTIGGCAKWNSPETGRAVKFPVIRMSPDSVSLEIAVAQLDPTQIDDVELFWSQLDHQIVPLELRKKLDANGIRIAVVPPQIPGVLQELLAPREIDPDVLDSFQQQMYEKGLLKPAERMLTHNKIQNRDGHTHNLPVSNVYPEKSWVVITDDGPSAGAGQSVRGIFGIKTFPQGDGSVRLRILPEIHHGQSRTQIGVVDRSFLFQSQQSINQIKELQVEVSLSPGETLVCGPTPDLADLGELFFGVPGSAPGNQRIVLIRLVQTQWDDLFSWHGGGDKLISATDE